MLSKTRRTHLQSTMNVPRLPVLTAVALAVACDVLFVPASRAESMPPQSVREAVAICYELAHATGSDGQSPYAAKTDSISSLPAAWVVPCLSAFVSATPAGANWLASGLDRAVDRLGDAVPVNALALFVGDATHATRARSLAFGWIKARDGARAAALLDSMLDDPALDLRRAAVEKLLVSVAQANETTQRDAYRRGLASARDVDQIEPIVEWLSEHGERMDVATVLGFVRNWRVSEAFDNAKGVGFAKAYLPETKEGGAVHTTGWKAIESADKHGGIDLNAAVELKKGILAYAVATVQMPHAGPAEVRIGSPCAVAVWVNGTPVMSHEIYHASEAIDQYVATADFHNGANTVMVKCCQNEQTEPWAVDWKFQLRICDALGKPLATPRKNAGGSDAE